MCLLISAELFYRTSLGLVGLALPFFFQASAAETGQQEVEEIPKILKSSEMRLHQDDSGRLFVPQKSPVFWFLSTSVDGSNLVPLRPEKDSKGLHSFILQEGENRFPHPIEGQEDLVIHADGTPPITELQFPETPVFEKSGTVFLGKDAQLFWFSKDSLSGVRETRISVDGGDFVSSKSLNLDLSRDADYSLRYYSMDHVGNAEESRSLSLSIDRTPPRTRLVFEGPHHGESVSSRSALILESKDSASGVSQIRYRIDEGPVELFSKPISVDKLEPGKHLLKISSVDQVQNEEPWSEIIFFHDQLPPQVEIVVEGGESRFEDVVYVSANSKIRLDAADLPAGVEGLTFQLDEEEPSVYQEAFDAPKDSGIHWIRTTATDRVGNSASRRLKLYVDGEPPVSDFRIEGAFYWSGKRVIINSKTRLVLTSTDLESRVKTLWVCLGEKKEKSPGNGKQAKKDEGFSEEENCEPYEEALRFLKEGSHLLRFFALDQVDNREQEHRLSIIVDNSPWAIDVSATREKHRKLWLFDEEKGLIGPAGLDFFLRISASPEKDAPSFLLSHDPQSKKKEKLFFSSNGLQRLEFSMPGTHKAFQIQIDGKVPRTKVSFAGAKRFKNQKTLFFSEGLEVKLTAEEPNTGQQSGVEKTYYSLDGSGFIPYQDPVRMFFHEKRYEFRYYSVDRVGNSESIRSLSFEVDLTPPKSTHEILPPYFGNILSARSSLILKSADGLSGVKTLGYRFDDEEERIYRRPLTGRILKDLEEGPHTLTYFSEDQVGNLEKESRIKFFIDHTPPVTGLRVLGEQHVDEDRGKTFVAATTRFRVLAKEKINELNLIRYAIDEGPKEPYKNPFLLPESEGRHQIRFDASDRVENFTPQVTRIFHLDLTPPELKHRLTGTTYPEGDRLYINAQTKIELSASDAGAGVLEILCRLNGGKVRGCRQPFSLKTSGPYHLEYFGLDRVKNRSSMHQARFFVDSEPPQVGIRTSPSGRKTGNLTTIGRRALVFLETEDRFSGVKEVFYSINGGPQILYRRSIGKLPKGGKMELNVLAEDWVGNQQKSSFFFNIE